MTAATPSERGETVHRPSRMLWHRLLRSPVAVACLAFLALLVVIAIVAPILFPDVARQFTGDLSRVGEGPSAEHLLGTDSLGRDVLERLLVGTQLVLIGVAIAVIVALVVGVLLGLIAGYFGRWYDSLITRLCDLIFSMPAIIIILVVLSVIPQSLGAAMVTLGVLVSPSVARLVRSSTLSMRTELYVEAAVVAGLSSGQILRRHILPRIFGLLVIQASLIAALALLTQSGLAFLNLVVPAPQPSWGGIVADGIQNISLYPWLIWPGGVAIALTVLALGLLADSLRDARAQAWSQPTTVLNSRRPRSTVSPTATPADSDVVLSVEGVSAEFDTPQGAKPVLQNVTFDVRPGETVGIVGESGCGKTAMAMAILGLLPSNGSVVGGHVWFDGTDLTALSDAEMHRIRGRRIALVSQEPMSSLNPAFRVGWQLEEVIRQHRRVSRRAAKSEAIALLRRVHLPDPEQVARKYPHQLSGGMAQRVCIARALAGRPQLLIADEPTTALDVTVQAEILDLLRELQRSEGMAIILVTHDLGVVADICQRVVVMYAGEVVERATAAELFHSPQHPYTDALKSANPQTLAHASPGGDGSLPAIPGTVPSLGSWPAGCHFAPRCPYATSACTAASVPLRTIGRPDHATRCLYDIADLHDAAVTPSMISADR
ncbi:dipeptide/oligopeptide/nickel ABC transporter permease/ATP-binding protein [Microbacterium sp. X-17]|uniref:dipeptide/oligopeptide/nickel ABC transporter permease/ATP-binding protein n=1 Tax=Microbacterium sp. X-17 TaxID=3144404 RepID=UPI0031F4801A